MTNEERTMLIQDKSLWKANEVLDENGQIKSPSYFDSFSVVSLQGKKAIVLCKSRNYNCQVVRDWYDDITMFGWSGDYRWNSEERTLQYTFATQCDRNAAYMVKVHYPKVELYICQRNVYGRNCRGWGGICNIT